MTRSELEKSPVYHIQGIQLSIYNMVAREKEIRNLSNLELAKKLNISQTRLRQILDGEFDGKLSQLVEIALKLGYTPEVKFYHPIFTNTKIKRK